MIGVFMVVVWSIVIGHYQTIIIPCGCGWSHPGREYFHQYRNVYYIIGYR